MKLSIKRIKQARNFRLMTRMPLSLLWYLIFAVTAVLILTCIFSFFGLIPKLSEQGTGLVYIFMGVSWWLLLLIWYFCFGVAEMAPETAVNQFITYPAVLEYLTIEAADIFDKAQILSEKNKEPFSMRHLILTALAVKKTKAILNRLGISTTKLRERILAELKGVREDEEKIIAAVFSEAVAAVVNDKRKLIELEDILAGIFKNDPIMSKLLFDLDLTYEDAVKVARHFLSYRLEYAKLSRFWLPENLAKTGGLAKDWAAGYTPNLNKYSSDVIVMAKKTPFLLRAHFGEAERVEQTLTKTAGQNVLLVGEPGIGKRRIVYTLAAKIAQGKSLPGLRGMHLKELHVPLLLSGAKEGEVEQRLNLALHDAERAGNIIIFIPRIHTLLGAKMEQVGSVDASAILLPFLRSPRIHIIGTITTAEYHQFIEPKLELLSQFEKIDIAPPSYDQVMDILLDVLPSYEFRSRVFVPYRTLKEAVILGGRYLKDKNFPLLGIELIDQLTTSLAARGRDFAKPSDVQEIISAAVHVPLGEVGGAEKEKLLNLEDLLHKRIIDQEEAISLIAQAMRRARAGVSAGKRPIGSFLFLGPTGVGKTETAKALAEVYFGSEKAMLRFDMSEYQQISSLDRLIGSPPGSPEAEAGGQLTNAVREKPFSLLLLDEIEKAHPDILNLFLQVFDEGHLTDSLGRKVDFRDTIIIATSNAGANIIREGVEKNEAFEDLRKKLMEYLMNEAIFRPEFLNRFDAVVMFKPITPENMEKVVTLMLQNLKSHLKEEKEIELVWDEKAVKNLAKKGYDPQFGARPLRRLIQDTLEADIAEKILRDELPRGSIYKVK